MPDDEKITDDKSATDDRGAAETVESLKAKLDAMTQHSRTWEARAKENKPAADKAADLQAKLDAIETAKLSDVEKTDKRIRDVEAKLADSEKARAAAEVTALRARIGAEKKLPAALIARLQGDDEGAIAADADALIAALPEEAQHVWPELGQGANGAPATSSNAAMNQRIREAAGRA